MPRLNFKRISILLVAAFVFFGFTIVLPPRTYADDYIKETVDYDDCHSRLNDLTGVSLSSKNFEAYTNGDPAWFNVYPIGFANVRSIIVIPDSQTDVGAGVGNTRAIGVSYSDGSWFLDGTWIGAFHGIEVHAFDDDNDDDEHHSTIHFAITCTSPEHERTIELCSIMDIRIHYEGEDPPEVARGFRNPCEESAGGSPPPQTPAAKTPSQPTRTSQQPAASPTIADIPGIDAYLNEIGEYTSGEGTVLWLKPTEGAKFKLGADSEEEHSIRIKSLGDKSATIVVASDPIEFTLGYGESRRVNVDREGDDDIEITMLNIADGQAGIKVKPLTKAAAVATVHAPPSTAKKATPIAAISASIAALLLAGAFFAYRKGLLSKLPISLMRKTPKTKSKAKKR